MHIYLDYNATTPVDKSVQNVICTELAESWKNPSSSYCKKAREVIEIARKNVANMINCQSEEIIFTSGGTESNHMVIYSAIQNFYENNKESANSNIKPHIITTNVEHDSVILPLKKLFEAGKIDLSIVKVLPVTGSLHIDDITSVITPTTCLISVMLANNETGILQNVKLLGNAINTINRVDHRKIFLHTDAAQALGKINVDTLDLGVDYLTIVGHKFYGPRIGALYRKSDAPFYPIFFGGGQEKNMRPGTENTCMIAGLGKAAELINENINVYKEHMEKIRNYLEDSLRREFPDKIVFNVSSDIERLPNTTNVAFNYPNLTGLDILKHAHNICASTGAACHSGGKPSGVLLASGVPQNLASKSLRLSVGRETTAEDIDNAVISIKSAIQNILSTL